MSVSAEIPDDMLRPAERTFAIDDPVVAEELPEPGREGPRVSQELHLAVKAELAVTVGAPEGGDKLSTKDPAQHPHRKEERVARFDPASVIRRQSTGWNNAMNVRMEAPALTIP